MKKNEHSKKTSRWGNKQIKKVYDDPLWLYGRHTVLAALQNPHRIKHRLVTISNTPKYSFGSIRQELISRSQLEEFLPKGAVHQGIALLTSPLPEKKLDVIDTNSKSASIVLILDQINDPRNVGAILRSSLAFNVDAVVLPERHSPRETSVLAKSASGALEKVPLLREKNISRVLDHLKKAGYWSVGLDIDAEQAISEANLSGKIVLVVGQEGKGLRALIKKKCDFLLRIPVSSRMNSLNVSNASAIALYEINKGL